MRVPFLDLSRSNAAAQAAVETRVEQVFAAQQFILGPTVEAFEAAICDYVGCKYAIGMSSGTDAELAILMAFGIGLGDAVITTPFTFFATAGCIHRVGAEPLFVDIDPNSFNLSLDVLRECLENRCRRDARGVLLSPRGNIVRAVVPVHLFGACAQMDEINALAEKHQLAVIEDASQAIGAEYPSATGTRRAGNLAETAFFSFFPTKNLGGVGDGGLVSCRDEAMAARLRILRNHGMEHRYHHCIVGGNFRLDAIQASVLHAKLPFLETWNIQRRQNAELYETAFRAAELTDFVTLPPKPWKHSGLINHHIYHQYIIRVLRREELMRHLEKHEIGHAIYYPVPLHLQECFAYLGHREGDFPEAEQATKEVLALPIFPGLSQEEIASVVKVISEFYRG